MNEERAVWGLVLAGGRSRRMGSDKALLEKGGKTQLQRSVELLDRHLERVFVSARPDQADDHERGRYPQVIDRYDDLGPVAGILSAMDEYPDVDWLVLACDLPNVDDVTIERLLGGRAAGGPFVAYASSHNGLPEPLCAVFAAGAADIVRQHVTEGIRCPRKMMIRAETRLLEQPHPSALDNVNTPEDLEGSGARVAS